MGPTRENPSTRPPSCKTPRQPNIYKLNKKSVYHLLWNSVEYKFWPIFKNDPWKHFLAFYQFSWSEISTSSHDQKLTISRMSRRNSPCSAFNVLVTSIVTVFWFGRRLLSIHWGRDIIQEMTWNILINSFKL